jgi:LysR family glycine cleavage system transcriptional activator
LRRIAQLPPLNTLPVFEVAARRLNFTHAARELGLTQTAVSHQIKLLERFLGAKLFHRRQRQLSLTSQGISFLAVVQASLNQLRSGTEEVIAASSRSTVTIGVPPTMGSHWLIPRLRRFAEMHAGIDIELNLALSTDAQPDRADAVIRFGKAAQWPELKAIHLFREDAFPVCSPTLATPDRPLRRPSDLLHHTLIHVSTHIDEWSRWLSAARVTQTPRNAGLRFELTSAALSAALAGLGVAIVWRGYVERELEDGRLIAPFPILLPPAGANYLTYREGAAKESALGLVAAWLQDEGKAEEAAAEAWRSRLWG